MATETQELPEVENIQAKNRELIDKLTGADEGEVKFASAAGTNMIRRRIRENGFQRFILPFKPISDDDLDRTIDSELPVMIEDMEPLSPGAVSLAFDDTPNTQFYTGDKYQITFSKISCVSVTCRRNR